LRKPSLRRGRGGSKVPLPGEVGGGQSLCHVRHQKTCAQAARLWPAVREPDRETWARVLTTVTVYKLRSIE
jgi:hypothetical protein